MKHNQLTRRLTRDPVILRSLLAILVVVHGAWLIQQGALDGYHGGALVLVSMTSLLGILIVAFIAGGKAPKVRRRRLRAQATADSQRQERQEQNNGGRSNSGFWGSADRCA